MWRDTKRRRMWRRSMAAVLMLMVRVMIVIITSRLVVLVNIMMSGRGEVGASIEGSIMASPALIVGRRWVMWPSSILVGRRWPVG